LEWPVPEFWNLGTALFQKQMIETSLIVLILSFFAAVFRPFLGSLQAIGKSLDSVRLQYLGTEKEEHGIVRGSGLRGWRAAAALHRRAPSEM